MYSLEERIYFDGAAAVTLADNNNNSTSTSENSDASSSADISSTDNNSTSANSTDSDAGTAKDTSSAPAKDTNSSTTADINSAASSTDSFAASGKVDIDALIASILNTDTASSDTTHTTLVVSTAVENADALATEAQEHNITVVTYDPAKETLQQLFKDIQSALNGEKASSINFVTTDNSAAGFSLISASTISAENISINSEVSTFVKETASLLTDGGRLTISGDASLTDSSFSALETAFADAAGVKVSFIDASNGGVTTSYADTQDVNVYFIDSSVKDSDKIASSLPENAVIVYLTKDGDGVAEITEYLSKYSGIDSVNIITHGNDGYILLGSDRLDSSTLASSYASNVEAWGNSLTAEGDIKIYSCMTAYSDSGKDFINEISSITSADVAASADATGIDGNWTLEYATGAVAANNLSVSGYIFSLDNVGSWNDLSVAIGNHITDIDITADLSATSTITVNYNVTIDGGGHTISNGGATTYFAVTTSGTDAAISNVTITGSTNSAITVASGTTLTLANCVFTHNSSATSGGAIYINGGTVTITGSTFGEADDTDYSNANTAVNGGAIYIASGSSSTLDNCNFYYNQATLGGGGAIDNNGILKFTGSSEFIFTGNKVITGSGGAIFNNGIFSENVFSGSYIFTKNTASGNAGAICFASGTTTTLTNAAFGDSTDTTYALSNSSNYGGALFIASGPAVVTILDNCKFYYNSATSGGGAIFIDGCGTLQFTGSSEFIFTGNKTISNHGGAIYSYGSISEISFSGTYTFVKNTAPSRGGAIYMASGSVILSGATFGVANDTFFTSANTATEGGAISIDSGTLTLSSSKFYYNKATYSAGAIWVDIGTILTFTGSSEFIFTGNKASNYGGAIFTEGTITEASFSGSYTFAKNTALYGSGGAICIYGGTVTMSTATFGVANDTSYAFANTAVSNGGAIANSGSLFLYSPKFYYNSAPQGGAIEISATLTFTGSSDIVFAGNKATTQGSAIYNNGTISIGSNTLIIDGSISGTGTFTGGSTSSITFTGTENIILPTVTNGLGNLTINGAGGSLTLGADLTIAGSLTLDAGYLDVGNYNLSLAATATVGGTPSSSAMILTSGTGGFIKYFDATHTSFLFPVGNYSSGTGYYSPITITFTSASYGVNAYASVHVNNSKESNVTENSYISRYWTIDSSNISDFTATVDAQYLSSDVTGTESVISGELYASSAWTGLDAVNTSAHSFSGTVSAFGNFTAYGHYTPPVSTTDPVPAQNNDQQPQEPDDNKNDNKENNSWRSDINAQMHALMPHHMTQSEMTLQNKMWNDISSRVTGTSNGLSNGERGVMLFPSAEIATSNPIIIDSQKEFFLTGTNDAVGLTGNYDYTPMSLWSSKFDKHPLFKSKVDKLLDSLTSV